MTGQKDLVNILKGLTNVNCLGKLSIPTTIEKALLKRSNGYITHSLQNCNKTTAQPLKPLKEKILEDLLSGKFFKKIETTELYKIHSYVKKVQKRYGAYTPAAWAEEFLGEIFLIGKKCKDFSENEKREIAELMIRAIEPIQINIRKTKYLHRTRLDCSVLQKRSALQFLVEHYGQFPLGKTTLSSELEGANIKESIKILDEIIDTWRDVSDSSEGESDPESYGASDMPFTHTWWPR